LLRAYHRVAGELPLHEGAMTVAGLAPAGVLFGFAVFLIGTGLF
jgi:hypothetical protein